MKRWGLWFLIGFAVYFIFTVRYTLYGDHIGRVDQILSLLFVSWAWITVLAVPIAVVAWLVRGTRRADP